MKILNEIKKTLCSACVYFTAAEFVILTIAEIFSLTAPTDGGSIKMFLSLGSTALIFLTCLFMSALNLVWRLRMSLTLRTLLHFVGTLLAWTLVFIVIPGVYTDTTRIIARVGIFLVLYVFIGLIALAAYLINARRTNDKTEYSPAFKGDSSK